MNVWRTVPGWDAYEVNACGAVRRKRYGRPLRPWLSRGYLMVSLCQDGELWKVGTHRLVALAFIGPIPAGDIEVAHGDGNRTNNDLANLRYVTPLGNRVDAARHGTIAFGERSPRAKLSDDQVTQIREAAEKGEKQRVIASRFGVHQAQVHRIVRMKSRRGFIVCHATAADMAPAGTPRAPKPGGLFAKKRK